MLVALCLASVLGLAGGTYLWELESLNRTTPVGRFKAAAEVLEVPRPKGPSVALVIGYDHRPEDGNAPSRSDTVMLLRTDPTDNTISMLSFPRDLIVHGHAVPTGGQPRTESMRRTRTAARRGRSRPFAS